MLRRTSSQCPWSGSPGPYRHPTPIVEAQAPCCHHQRQRLRSLSAGPVAATCAAPPSLSAHSGSLLFTAPARKAAPVPPATAARSSVHRIPSYPGKAQAASAHLLGQLLRKTTGAHRLPVAAPRPPPTPGADTAPDPERRAVAAAIGQALRSDGSNFPAVPHVLMLQPHRPPGVPRLVHHQRPASPRKPRSRRSCSHQVPLVKLPLHPIGRSVHNIPPTPPVLAHPSGRGNPCRYARTRWRDSPAEDGRYARATPGAHPNPAFLQRPLAPAMSDPFPTPPLSPVFMSAYVPSSSATVVLVSLPKPYLDRAVSDDRLTKSRTVSIT